MNFCTNCGANLNQNWNYVSNLAPSRFDKILLYFQAGILVIFLLSMYFFVQILLGFILFSVFAENPSMEDASSISLTVIVMILSNIIMVGLITKISPSTFGKSPSKAITIKILVILILLLFFLLFFLELVLMVLNHILDTAGLSSDQLSPYDSFFEDPVNYILFAILAVSIGPVFEELVFRQVLINTMHKQINSRYTLVIISAIIFALSHTAGDLIDGSLRYAILHLAATFILGVFLGMLFIYKGLKTAIIFHSLWNFFSIIIQVMVELDQISLLDTIVIILFIISTSILIWLIHANRKEIKSSLIEVNFPQLKDTGIIVFNLILILAYELALPLTLYSEPDFIALTLILIFQFLGVIFGIIFIENERRINRSKGFRAQKSKIGD